MIDLTSDTHLTQTNRRHIEMIFKAGLMAGKIGRTNYNISRTDADNGYCVAISAMDRGLMPVWGEKIRLSTYRHTFKWLPEKVKIEMANLCQEAEVQKGNGNFA
jgi:hypothetical protein